MKKLLEKRISRALQSGRNLIENKAFKKTVRTFFPIYNYNLSNIYFNNSFLPLLPKMNKLSHPYFSITKFEASLNRIRFEKTVKIEDRGIFNGSRKPFPRRSSLYVYSWLVPVATELSSLRKVESDGNWTGTESAAD